MYFSQFGEDKRLHKIFGSHCGTCVEVGAYDGSHFSNTRFFEQQGWTCVLVEPNPSLWPLIQASRPNSKLFKCAASASKGKLVLHILPGDDSIATVSVDKSTYHEKYEVGTPVTEIEIEAIPLDSILESSGVKTVDFVSIDVEGHEMEVLKGFSLSRWNPRIVLLEDNSDFQDESVPRYMGERGYVRCCRTHTNDWYSKATDTELVKLANNLQIQYWKTRQRLRRSWPVLIKLKRALLG